MPGNQPLQADQSKRSQIQRSQIQRSQVQGVNTAAVLSALPLSSGLLQRAQHTPHTLQSGDIQSLQRTVGNHMVQRLLAGGGAGQSQTPSRKLKVGPSNDRYEQEADRVASSVVANSRVINPQVTGPQVARTPSPTVQRKQISSIRGTASQGVIQRDDFEDKAQEFNDPQLLKRDREQKKVLPAGGQFYHYNATTGVFDPTPQTAAKDFKLVEPKKKIRKDENGTKTVGYFSGKTANVWIAASQLVERQAGYVASGESLFPEVSETTTDEEGKETVTQKPRLPQIEDIAQAQLGDCYLEAALISIVSTKPQYIHQMMRDNGTSVTVRLYEVNRKDPQNLTFKPHYIKVQKSTVKGVLGDNIYQKGSLWVAMIQKAYAASGITGRAEKRAKVSKLKPGSMESIDGGRSNIAFEVLLGTPATRTEFDSGPAQSDRSRKLAGLPWSKPEIRTYDKVAVPQDNYDGLVSKTIFNDDDKVDDWMAWVKQKPNQKAIEKVFQLQKDAMVESEVRLEHFVSVFQKQNLKDELKLPLVTFLAHHFPGKRGRGVYTDRQLEVYQSIVDALGAGKHVTVSTKREVGRSVTDRGQSGGEQMSKGLAGTHAYAVLGVKQSQRLNFVKVRNPWGNYGRQYEWEGQKLKAKENRDVGTFWIELSDLTKRFYAVSTGGGAG